MAPPILRRLIKKPHPLWVKFVLVILRILLSLYNVLSYLPFQLFAPPAQRLIRSNRQKAKPLIEGDPSTPYRNVQCPKGQLLTEEFKGCDTVAKLFERAMNEFSEKNCLGNREIISVDQEKQPNGRIFEKLNMGEYIWTTYDELNSETLELGSGLLKLNHKVNDRAVIFSETRSEWITTAIACFRFKFPIVTVYSTLGDDAIVHSINESEAVSIFTSHDLVPKVMKLLPHLTTLKRLIYYESTLPGAEPLDEKQFDSVLPRGFKIINYEDLTDLGAENGVRNPPEKPTPDDLAVIMYTSGTTGLPKGVLMSHRNIVSASAGHIPAISSLGIRPDDVYIAYLPLAHIFELACEIGCITHGVQIGYSSALTLVDTSSKIKRGAKGDASVLRPTLMTAVPAIMDRLYKTVLNKVENSSPLMRALFEFVYEIKRGKIEDGYDTPFFNRLIFPYTRAILGGRVRIILSGGAPLNPETQRFMNICFCCPVNQGYGLTETCAAGTCCDDEDLNTGHVGPPLMCNDVMLRDWKEGGYSTSNKPYPQGEVLISGANVTMGYLNNPAKTAEDFIEIDGRRWFCTGDIGQCLPDGNMKIIDRKKELVKLQHGEYISLTKVESILITCPLVDNIYVYGNSNTEYLVAVVVPNRKSLESLGQKVGVKSTDFETLRTNKEVCDEFLKKIQEHSVKNKLEKFEVVGKVYLCEEIWSVHNGMLTEALKLKRKPLENFYKDVLEKFYAK